jgi:hypothetical protein
MDDDNTTFSPKPITLDEMLRANPRINDMETGFIEVRLNGKGGITTHLSKESIAMLKWLETRGIKYRQKNIEFCG